MIFWTIVVSTTILLSIYSVRKQNKQTNKQTKNVAYDNIMIYLIHCYCISSNQTIKYEEKQKDKYVV